MSAFEKAIVSLCVLGLMVLSSLAVYRDFRSPVVKCDCKCRCNEVRSKPIGEPVIRLNTTRAAQDAYRAFKQKYGDDAEPVANSWGDFGGVP